MSKFLCSVHYGDNDNVCSLTDPRVFKRDSHGGCFGDGPGRLSLGEINPGVFSFDARLMQPGVQYVMTVVVQKDVRVSSASQTVHVINGNPPNLLISSVHSNIWIFNLQIRHAYGKLRNVVTI